MAGHDEQSPISKPPAGGLVMRTAVASLAALGLFARHLAAVLDLLQQLGQGRGAALQAVDHRRVAMLLQLVTRPSPGLAQTLLEHLPVRAVAGLQPGQGLVLVRR
ncbi:hypothetical protein D3C78_1000050 [compost metagenome]